MLYVFDDCILDIQCYVLCRAGQPVSLRPKAFQVLHYLLLHRDRVVAKQELAEHIWPDQFISDAVLESTVRAVRRALGDDRHTQGYIQTLRGYGYRFVATVEERVEAGPGATSLISVAPHAPVVCAMPELDDVKPCPTMLAPVPRAAALPPEVLLPPVEEESPATVGPLSFEPPETLQALPRMDELQAKILVVDDEADNIRLLEVLLLRRGYAVIKARNGAEALQQVYGERPDLILLDVMMPEMDGFTVCRWLKDDPRTCLIPVVLMTMLGDVKDRIQGLEAGADDFLTKPVHRDELLARIRTSLSLKRTIYSTIDSLHLAQDVVPLPLYLTIARQGNTITVELTEVAEVVPRERRPIEENLLTEISTELNSILLRAHLQDCLDTPMAFGQPDTLDIALQRLGRLIFSHLLPVPIQQKLAAAVPTDLLLRLDPQLVQVPWELAFDGKEFLLTKFRTSRQVVTPQLSRLRRTLSVQVSDSLKLLIIVDPTERVSTAMQEATQLNHALTSYPHLEVVVMGGKQLRKIDLLLALSEYHLVHFIGSTYFDVSHSSRSGWVWHNAVLTAAEFAQAAHPSVLVFANTCQAEAIAPGSSTNQWY